MNSRVEKIELDKANFSYWSKLFLNLLEKVTEGSIEIQTPEGEFLHFGDSSSELHTNIVIKDWRLCEYLFLKGDIGLGESYIKGHWESDNISNLIEIGIRNSSELEKVIKGSILKLLFYRFKHLLRPNSKKGSERNIHAHYDIGNDFYKRWLDKTMTYSSGLFIDDDLQRSQENKYEKILESSGAVKGDHILEIGCGWGGFAEYACERGIKITGVTISKEQYEYAKKRLNKYGDLCDIRYCDYRDLDGKFSYIVSIEMFEAIGEKYWPVFFKKVHDLLTDDGKAIIQTITINNKDFSSYRRGTDFIQQYIFPGGMLPSPAEFTKYAYREDLGVRHIRSFGKDYAKTLRIWRENFMSVKEELIREGFDNEFIRTWKFYLEYCEGGFMAEKISVYHFEVYKE